MRRRRRWGGRRAPGDPHGRHRPGRRRPDPARDPHAGLLDAVDGRAGEGGHRQHEGCRVRRHGRLLGLRVRVFDGAGVHQRGPRGARRRHRCGAAGPASSTTPTEARASSSATGPGGRPSASDEPGGALGIELTTDPQGAYMIWPRRAGRRHLRPPTPLPGASITCAWRATPRIGSRRRRWRPWPWSRSGGPGSPRRHRPVHPAPGQHPDHRGGGEGSRPADGPDLRQP